MFLRKGAYIFSYMQTTGPLGQFLKILEIDIFALIFNLPEGVGISETPNDKSNRCGNKRR